jgi:hypothetical protein
MLFRNFAIITKYSVSFEKKSAYRNISKRPFKILFYFSLKTIAITMSCVYIKRTSYNTNSRIRWAEFHIQMVSADTENRAGF